jgi:hypothetical protein
VGRAPSLNQEEEEAATQQVCDFLVLWRAMWMEHSVEESLSLLGARVISRD